MATLSNELPQKGSNSSSAAAATAATAAEDESMKRNTDCVYFLASPLTCKKGNECEFRHSESARTNPRDCWYWLNGNCLNPKCAFRHPPLDVLAPSQAGNLTGPSPPIPPSGPPVPPKQAVPCIFFQQGFCLKADRCPFLHGPAPQSNTMIRQTPATTTIATGAPTFKKSFCAPEKVPQNRTGFLLTAPKVVEAPRQPHTNTAPKVIEGTPGYKETTRSVENGSFRSRAARMHHPSSVDDKNHHSRRDDDTLRESSPEFDVLVDDKLSKDKYYPDEDKYTSIRGHEGRRLNEFSHHVHLDSVAYVDLDNYRSEHDYNSFNSLQDEYAQTHCGASSERRTAHERRGLYKSKSPDFTQNSSDLRHRLSQQRKGNGVRSVVSPDYKPDYISEDIGYRSSQRDTRLHDRSVGSRLQGRIKLPVRSPPVSGVEREVSSHQSRLRDRLSGRIRDESNEGKNFRGQVRKDSMIQGNGREFSGTQRLSELQGASRTDNKQQQSTVQQSESGGKFRDTVLGSSLGTEGDISFDGPKSLSEILKRKRKDGMTSTNIVNVENKDLNKQIESTSNSSTGMEKQVVLSSASEQTQGDVQQQNNKCMTVDGDEEEGEISNKKVKLIEGESSVPDEEKHAEEQVKLIEDESSVPEEEKHAEEDEGQLGADGEEHEVDEEYDQGDEEYDYEQDDDVEGYNLDDGEVYEENAADIEEDFMDEDDGDDFAKKLGVSF